MMKSNINTKKKESCSDYSFKMQLVYISKFVWEHKEN